MSKEDKAVKWKLTICHFCNMVGYPFGVGYGNVTKSTMSILRRLQSMILIYYGFDELIMMTKKCWSHQHKKRIGLTIHGGKYYDFNLNTIKTHTCLQIFINERTQIFKNSLFRTDASLDNASDSVHAYEALAIVKKLGLSLRQDQEIVINMCTEIATYKQTIKK